MTSTHTPLPPSAAPSSRTTAALVGAGLAVLTLTAALAWQVGRHSAPPVTAAAPLAAALPAPEVAPSVPAAAAEPLTPPATPQAPPPAPRPAVAQASPAPVHTNPPVRVATPTRTVVTSPAQTSDAQGNATFEPSAPAAEPAPSRVPAWACASCGVVESVTPIQRDGDANGVGAVAGGVLGGLIGSQMGGGNGKRAATVIGAIGGGIAGHQIEKKMHSQTSYEVRVRMDDGSWRSVNQSQPAQVGARVSVEGGVLRPAPVQDGVRS